MRSKTLVTKQELAAWMTAELRKSEGCEECEIYEPFELVEADEKGCNWSPASSVLATGVPRKILGPAFGAVLAEAQKEIEVFSKHSRYYSYAFFVMQK